jgi:cytochrome b pre-mRNA-processing protein 3
MISLFRHNSCRRAANEAYRRVVAQARRPEFFELCGIPDTIDGRFELICLHAFLYLHRIKDETPPAGELGQYFFDEMFADFDRSLREMGTGDLSVGRQVKRMAQSFYGRIEAYERGLTDGEPALRAALVRNLFGTEPTDEPRLEAMADYLRREEAWLRSCDTTELLSGRVAFGPPPAVDPQSAAMDQRAAS